jgi:hypothetical protein
MIKYKQDYIKIENLSQFIIKELEHYHPDDPRYIKYWKKIKKNCVEGVWGNEFGGYRYMPGRLYFYGNFGTILDVNKEDNTRKAIKPLIRDIEWERAYMVLEAEGFSGWSEDDEYTSDKWALDLRKSGLPSATIYNKWKPEKKKRYFSLINKEGKLKTYIKPRENIRKIHDTIKGIPLYWNSTKNISELGSRGGK